MINHSPRRKFWPFSVLAVLACTQLSMANAAETNNTRLIQPIVTHSQTGKIGARIQESLNQNQTVTVTIQLTRVSADLKQKLTALKIKVLQISERYLLASVQLTPDSNLKGLENLSEVLHISQDAGTSHNAGEAVDHSVTALNVDQLQSSFSDITGKGVRIGIISDSFAHSSGVRGDNTTPAIYKSGTLTNAVNQLSGDLPAMVELRNDSSTASNTDEGAAMAENIHDIAPGADISFYSDHGSEVGFVEAVNDLCKSNADGGAGADIIVDDTIFYAEPFYQPSIINQAIQECVDSGVMFFTIAGNDNQRSYEFTYQDVDPDTADTHPSSGDKIAYGNDFHQWPNGSAFLPITIPAGSHIRAVLNWNQPYISYQTNKVNFPLIDFDMFLFEKDASTGQMSVVYSSYDAQGQNIYNDPFEQLWYTNDTSSTQTLYLAVNHWSGNTDVLPQNADVPVKLDLRFPATSDDVTFGLTFNSSMMFGHAYAEGAITVASMPWYRSEPYVNAADVAVEYETSKGSANHPFYFNLDGFYAYSTQKGPTLTGTDGGNTTFFGEDIPTSWNVTGEPDGYPNFFGTSSAAPTVAGVAALLKQYAGPDVSNDLIKQALVSTARDITESSCCSTGWDDVSGAGEVDAQAALNYLKDQLGK